MIILGIETSCDETAASIVKDGHEVLASTIASSAELHEATGGIIPEQAARRQIESILPVIDHTMKGAGLTHSELDAIAVTVGPGLIGSLLVGVETAKTLALTWGKPLIPVNHMVGHVYAAWLDNTITFPVLALVVSGGHTDLVLLKSNKEMEFIGGTRDDAAGEAFDKTARLLGLPYPGGPAISKSAQEYLDKHPDAKLTMLPRPLAESADYDWSFSGLKTAVHKVVQDGANNLNAGLLAAEVQEAIVDVLVNKTVRAAKDFRPKTVVLCGGVAANKLLRERLADAVAKLAPTTHLAVPEFKFCTDNAAMVATAAQYVGKPVDWREVVANPSLTITDSPT